MFEKYRLKNFYLFSRRFGSICLLVLISVSNLSVLGGFLLVSANPENGSSDEYRGPEYCLTCHPWQYSEWNGTTHSNAYRDPIFQEMWEEKGKPDVCLQCHTTGYNETTKTFAVEGVTCERCHGPGDMMEINTKPELCEQCHTGSRAREIQLGAHGIGGVKCVDCHMRMGGHTFVPMAEACAQCHTSADIHTRSEIPELRSQVSTLQGQVSQLEGNISQLQSQVEEQKAALVRSDKGYVYMLYGGAAATMVVLVGIVGFSVRRRSI